MVSNAIKELNLAQRRPRRNLTVPPERRLAAGFRCFFFFRVFGFQPRPKLAASRRSGFRYRAASASSCVPGGPDLRQPKSTAGLDCQRDDFLQLLPALVVKIELEWPLAR